MEAMLPRRLNEAGKIRIGRQIPIPPFDKAGKPNKRAGEPMADRLQYFRLTSNSMQALQLAAAKYHGEVRRWTVRPEWQEQVRTPDHQFELYTESDTLDILIRADALMQTQFEQWDGAYCTRRCTGEWITFDGYGKLEGLECQCPADLGERKLLATQGKACMAVSRLCVMLEGLPLGQWRLDTRGDNTPAEIRGLQDILADCGLGTTMLRATMRLESRTSRIMVQGKKVVHHYSCVVIEPRYTPEQLLEEGARHQAKLLAMPDESTKTVSEHIADLAGDQDAVQSQLDAARRGASSASPIYSPLQEQINRLLTAQGATSAAQEVWWNNARREYPDLTPGVLTILLEKLQDPPVAQPSYVPPPPEGFADARSIATYQNHLGWSLEQQHRWQNKQVQRFKKTYSALSDETLRGLLRELHEQYPKDNASVPTESLPEVSQSQEGFPALQAAVSALQVDQPDTASLVSAFIATEPPSLMADGEWRIWLNNLLLDLEDVTLAQEGQSMLVDPEASDEAGHAMVLRLRTALLAQQAERDDIPF